MNTKKDKYRVLTPGKLKPIPSDAKYISERGKIYDIKKDHTGLFTITPRQGGLVPKVLKQKFLSKNKAHDTLVRYLRKKEKFGRAVWPNRKT